MLQHGLSGGGGRADVGILFAMAHKQEDGSSDESNAAHAADNTANNSTGVALPTRAIAAAAVIVVAVSIVVVRVASSIV
ncbi:hypothetical protein NQ176_g6748 [Zarea fungicola]|uniref:Uncharacterized protein n=1 Tax=Zarea fungicola TaxID=93591 RepID=A0ACC1N3H9_9HYPO|nr:hypothetical protein NQ176_g6748 [Lecanicillium fungicola]